MEESILTSIKLLCGVPEEQEAFDQEIMIHINTAFNVLFQLGVGPKDPFKITGADETWSEFIEDNDRIEMVRQYIYLKVRLIFDPPSNTSVAEAFRKQADELEWRLNVTVDGPDTFD